MTDFIHFVLPGLPERKEKELAREILTALKHLPGQHDQASHGGNPQSYGELARTLSESGMIPPAGWSDTDSPHIVYHGTNTEAIDSILKNGITAKVALGDRPSSVYFTDSKREAETWAHTAKSLRGGDAIIVEFKIPRNYAKMVVRDEIDTFSLGTMSSFRIEKDIPPEWITNTYDMKEAEDKYYIVVLTDELNTDKEPS